MVAELPTTHEPRAGDRALPAADNTTDLTPATLRIGVFGGRALCIIFRVAETCGCATSKCHFRKPQTGGALDLYLSILVGVGTARARFERWKCQTGHKRLRGPYPKVRR